MSLGYLILGLLDLAPMTGYDLKKTFDGSVAHFWTADQAQIYRTLSKLVDEEAVEVRVVRQAGRPDRREHHITDTGRRALADWLASPLERERIREPFVARMFFAGREEPAVTQQLLTQRRAETERRILELQQLPRPAGNRAERLRTATLDHGIRQFEAELAWIDDLEELL